MAAQWVRPVTVQSVSTLHSTHMSVAGSQILAFAPVQSVLTVHWTQRFVAVSQTVAVPPAPVQSPLFKHSTQVLVPVLQTRSTPVVQSVLMAHDLTHVFVDGSHAIPVPQFALARHATHWPAVEQYGLVAVQSPPVRQATQEPLTQCAAAIGQLLSVRHCTQVPLVSH
jgi:hypothetical protein